MTPRTKSALLLVVTLVVGVLIGVLATSAVWNHRLEQLSSLRNRGGFSEMIEKVIEPTDDDQRARIRAVLERSEARLHRARTLLREELRANTDSLRAELAPLLTPDQRQRLDDWFAQERDRYRGRRKSDRPRDKGPPGGRPR